MSEISDLQVNSHGDSAIVTGTWVGKGVDGMGKPIDTKERWVDTWVKNDGKWQVRRLRIRYPDCHEVSMKLGGKGPAVRPTKEFYLPPDPHLHLRPWPETGTGPMRVDASARRSAIIL